MCGISGICNISNLSFSIKTSDLNSMKNELNHRGPDDSGIWASDYHKIGFAHNRLSIIDLSSSGHQPMLDSENTIVVSFNGEIYNYKSLKKELTILGHNFRSNTDTETIIYAYKEWGIDFLDKLDGMFAIALFDLKKNELFLIRDRIGIKPLYFSIQSGILSFASEIKALWPLAWNKKEFSKIAIYHYLSFMVSPAPYTIFRSVYKLPAGFYMHINHNRKISFKEWYDPIKTLSPREKADFEDENFCLENIGDLLVQATEKRLMSDVPFGAFLSGGIDSSLNVALMSEYTNKINTFTIGFSDQPESNEMKWARLVAKKFDTNHHEVIISEKEAFEFYEKMVYHLDEPLADCVCIPFYYVSKLAKESGMKVVQVGEGADELFFGYDTYAKLNKFHKNVWAPSERIFPTLAKMPIYHLAKLIAPYNHSLQELIFNWAGQRNLFWGGAIAFNEHQKKAILEPSIFRNNDLEESNDQIAQQIFKEMRQEFDGFSIVDFHSSKIKDGDFGQKMLYLELKQRLPELLLMRADKMSMASGIEARVPFLDHNLVEFMLNVPLSLKFKHRITKYLLKKFAKNWLPEEIINRKKVGFAAPTVKWFEHGRLFPKYFNEISKTNKLKNQLFKEEIREITKTFSTNKSCSAVQSWTLQNLWAMK
jgi:asparagine synthase (glutamine-hydrolysing)